MLNHSSSERTSGTLQVEQQDQLVHSVECVAFCPSMNWVATACLGGELRIWDLANNKCRHVCHHECQTADPSSHPVPDGITNMQWYPKQPKIVTGCISGRAFLWDARSGECLQKIQCHASEMILSLLIHTYESQDGKEIDMLYTAGDDTTIRRFLLN